MAKKVAGYGRVSTQSQADGTSPEEQKQSIEEECKRRGNELVAFYSDIAFSGSDDNRPGLRKLLQDANTKQFEIVMFTKLDRLGRNLRDIKNILHEISNSGLNFICVHQPEINNEGFYGNLLLNVLGSFAEFERSMIKDRVSRGRIRRWKEGGGAIGSLPLGYIRVNGKIETDPKGAELYQRIVSMYLYENYSLRDIAIKLTSDGTDTPSGRSKKWHNVTISDILKNPAYTGKAIQNQFEFVKKRSVIKRKQYYCVSKNQKPPEEWISIEYPPLITLDKFDQIRAKTEHQKRKPKKHHVGYDNHFMAENILFCGYCGSRIRKSITPAGSFFYCCYWWQTSPKERQMFQKDKCKLKYEDAEHIDDMIINEIVQLLSNPGRFAKVWFKNVDLEDLKKSVDGLRERDKELRSRLTEGFKKIKNTQNPELREIYQSEIQKDEKDFEENKYSLREAEGTLAFTQNKYDRLAEFNEAINQNKAKSAHAWYLAQSQFANFLYDLPFQEKKRIVESVISPENGGRILIRYGTKAEESEGELLFEMNFGMDLNRIETLITGINKGRLLNKVGSR
jgi:site-specific DNA recombinase